MVKWVYRLLLENWDVLLLEFGTAFNVGGYGLEVVFLLEPLSKYFLLESDGDDVSKPERPIFLSDLDALVLVCDDSQVLQNFGLGTNV